MNEGVIVMKFFKKCWILLFCFSSFFSIDSVPGHFDPVPGSPFATVDRPNNIAFSPLVSGNLFAAVVSLSEHTVAVYSVNSETGEFVPVSGSPFATGNQPVAVIFSPVVSGNLFAAVANNSDHTISIYLVDQTTGLFTPVEGSPFIAGNGLLNIAFSPVISGNLFLAATNQLDHTVSAYQVNQETGFLTPVPGSPFAMQGSPADIAFSPIISENLFVAVSNLHVNAVSVYSVDSVTGTLTSVSNSPFATGDTPLGLAFSPLVSDKVFAAVANLIDNNVSVYQMDPMTGFLTSVEGSPFVAGTFPFYISFSPNVGNVFAAVTNYSDANVSVYQMDKASGVFKAVPGSPFAAGQTPMNVKFSPLVSGNLFAAIVNSNDDSISVYKVALTTPCDLFFSPLAFTATIKQEQPVVISFVIVGGSGPYSIEWSDGFVQTLDNAGTFSRIVNPAATTHYAIKITDAHDCSVTAQATITVIPSALICSSN
jgi:6-phosphogluconolactonase (cycloisomerase 2 family)